MKANKNTMISLMVGLALLLTGFWWYQSIQPTQHESKQALTAGLVVAGKLGDKSYNDLTYEGFQRAVKELGLEARVVEPADPSEMKIILTQLAEKGTSLIVGIGFTAKQPIAELAPQYPQTRFLLIDDIIESPPPNVRSIQFREHEAGFLAGIVAGLVTKTGKVGVVAGIDLPVVRRYVNGYKQGVKYVNPNAQVLVNFAGSFSDPAKGKELSLGLYASGADVILNGAGQTGDGIFQAAKTTGHYAIGVDLDQSGKAPGQVLTSAIKRVDLAIDKAIRDTMSGKFVSGVSSLGVSDGVIDLAPLNTQIIPVETRTKIQEAVAAVKEGHVRVIENYDRP